MRAGQRDLKGEEREEVENSLKNIWIAEFEESRHVGREEVERLDELLKDGLVEVKGDRVVLTEKGKEMAERIIRLHRLAERLLLDVLGTAESSVEQNACRFEHFLSREVEEAICTLLGHPEICPHGRRIPKGKCCEEREEEVKRVIYRLSELNPGEEGEIKYIAGDERILKKVIAVGLLPGKRVKVIRVFPGAIIQAGNTQFAVDEEIADTIYVLKV